MIVGKVPKKRSRSKGPSEKKKVKYDKIPQGLPGGKYTKKISDADMRFCDYYGQVLPCMDNQAAFANVNVGAVCMNLIANGPAYYQRDGNTIAMKWLNIKASLQPTNNAGTAQNNAITRARIMIVYDQNCNGIVIPKSTLLMGTGSTGLTETTMRSPLGPAAKNRFVVLRDEFLSLPPYGAQGQVHPTSPFTYASDPNNVGLGGTQQSMSINWHIPLQGKAGALVANYLGPTDNLGDLNTGALWLLYLTDEMQVDAAIPPQPSNQRALCALNYSARLKYHP